MASTRRAFPHITSAVQRAFANGFVPAEEADDYEQSLREELETARIPPQPCPNHDPPWHYVSNPSCTSYCSWRENGPRCIQCVFAGAWIDCPCFIRLEGHVNLYGEDHVHHMEWRFKMYAQWAKRKWLIVHPIANLQRERNIFRAAQLWKVISVSDVLTLVGSFYSAGITISDPVKETI